MSNVSRRLGLAFALAGAATLLAAWTPHAASSRAAASGGPIVTLGPFLARGTPRAKHRVKASLLGTTKRKDGKLQVTYAGHPLYYFARDAKAGDTNGQGFLNLWNVTSAAGAAVGG